MAQLPDIEINSLGSIFLLTPLSCHGQQWIADNLAIEAWQFVGDAIAVEPRYAMDIADAMQADGLRVR